MCGIYGKYIFKGELDINNSLDALNLIKHRGPDGFGFEYGNFTSKVHELHHNITPLSIKEINPTYFLGHRRLSIIDLSENAYQPMDTPCKRYSVTFNGEIYNHIELKEELLKEGCQFKTDHSDTEVLLNSYLTWGNKCVDKFRGMFAFAVFDRVGNTLFIARDRIGKKTVYYELNDESFSFASELPPIIKSGSQRKINPTALNLYMQLGYIPYPHSIFEGVKKLPPATYALIDLNTRSMEVHEYWDIVSILDRTKNSVSAVQETKQYLKESVEYRLRADVSVGAFISGGTDSTLIVKNISEVSSNRLDIYGADFPNTNRSEKKYIIQAAEKYKQNLKLSEIDLDHISNIEAIIDVFDEPFDGASSIALFDLFKEAAKDHKIILTGDGGDEMFAGYTRYLTFPKQDAFIKLLQKLTLPKLILNIGDKLGILPVKLKSLKALLEGDSLANFSGLNSRSPHTGLLYTNLLNEQFQIKNIHQSDIFSSIIKKINQKEFSTVKALQYFELKTILPGRMLYKLDRFSMFYGIEARSPFLDHKLVEMAYSIPDEVNLANDIPKSVLKDILSQDFDDSFVHREKQGFGNPLSNWFKESDPETIFSILLNKQSYIFNFLNYEKLHRTFYQIKKGYDGEGEKDLWRILVLAHYFENYKSFIHI